MTIEIAFPFLAIAFALAGVVFFDRYGKRLDAQQKRKHPAE